MYGVRGGTCETVDGGRVDSIKMYNNVPDELPMEETLKGTGSKGLSTKMEETWGLLKILLKILVRRKELSFICVTN